MNKKFQIKKIKSDGKKVFYRSAIKTIAICLIVTILVGGTTISLFNDKIDFFNVHNYESYFNRFAMKSNFNIISDFIKESETKIVAKTDKFLENATSGVLAEIANSVSKSESFIFGILNALNKMIFQNKIGAGIVILIGVLISAVYWLLVSNVIVIGKCRFFLENSNYKDTKLKRIFFPYKLKKEWNVAKVVFKKKLYQLLWSFTIVFGFIKKYAYSFVYYIVAENPDISAKEAIKMSSEMTNGYKWKLFLLDLSFIGYRILGVITLNVFNLIYTNPYKECVMAEVYMNLRREYIRNKEYNYKFLCDSYLDVSLCDSEYPKDNYFLPEKRMKKEINNVNIKYPLDIIILLFFTYSFIGYIWEVLLHLFQDGVFVNRGTLYGPYLPIYGFGGILSLLLLKKYSKNLGLTFGLSMVLCGIIEYFTSWYLEVLYDMKWWNYTGYLFNINGRICLEGLLVFAFGCSVSIYILSPLFKSLFEKIKYSYRVIISIIFILIILVDFGFSIVRPNQGEGISSPNNNVSNQIYTK